MLHLNQNLDFTISIVEVCIQMLGFQLALFGGYFIFENFLRVLSYFLPQKPVKEFADWYLRIFWGIMLLVSELFLFCPAYFAIVIANGDVLFPLWEDILCANIEFFNRILVGLCFFLTWASFCFFLWVMGIEEDLGEEEENPLSSINWKLYCLGYTVRKKIFFSFAVYFFVLFFFFGVFDFCISKILRFVFLFISQGGILKFLYLLSSFFVLFKLIVFMFLGGFLPLASILLFLIKVDSLTEEEKKFKAVCMDKDILRKNPRQKKYRKRSYIDM